MKEILIVQMMKQDMIDIEVVQKEVLTNPEEEVHLTDTEDIIEIKKIKFNNNQIIVYHVY